AKRSMRAWSIVSQSLTATSWPTQVASSARVSKVFMAPTLASTRPPPLSAAGHSGVQPAADRPPLRQVLLHARGGDVEQRQPMRGQVDVVLRVAQKAQHRPAQTGHELAQLVGGDGALVHPHAHDAHLHTRRALALGQLIEEGARGVDVEDARL